MEKNSVQFANDLFSGRKALVVGGTSGLGNAVALTLAKTGASVTVTGRHAPESKSLLFIPVDFERDGIQAVFSPEFQKALSACEILCVSYGPFVRKSIVETTVADWEKVSLFDYALPGILTSTALQSMSVRKWGRILLFGGTRTDAIRAYRSNAAYAGAKTGVSVLVKSVAAECAEYAVTCNGILPGFAGNGLQEIPQGWEAVTSREIAQKALFLLSSPDLNGVLLTVDRGWNP